MESPRPLPSERRAEYFLKAAALYSQSRDERELNRALDCAGRAAKYRLNALGKRERDKAASAYSVFMTLIIMLSLVPLAFKQAGPAGDADGLQ